ncbi:MAG: M23 family metallopeptidase, partial [Deltaproteobacteria bacterium]|nr:M23 family metallopeptidase [Deltaproteobacteria bacterium]
FATVSFAADSGNKEKFLKINRDLRQKNAETFYDLRTRTSEERLWGDENWARLRNAATMARFADHRTYYYRGKKIDEQVHLGVDLASLAQSPVQATNSGRTIFTGDMGIYGLTVVIDHGQGISSGYSHLSKISVQTGQEISRGEEIGFTGQTGLAGGDHLHFGIMVHGIPVNPIEWWDPHWVEDNILRKLRLLDGK